MMVTKSYHVMIATLWETCGFLGDVEKPFELKLIED